MNYELHEFKSGQTYINLVDFFTVNCQLSTNLRQGFGGHGRQLSFPYLTPF